MIVNNSHIDKISNVLHQNKEFIEKKVSRTFYAMGHFLSKMKIIFAAELQYNGAVILESIYPNLVLIICVIGVFGMLILLHMAILFL